MRLLEKLVVYVETGGDTASTGMLKREQHAEVRRLVKQANKHNC